MTDTKRPTGTQQAGETTPDSYSRSCPSRSLLKPLGDLWTVFVVGALHKAGQPQRFKEISTRVGGILIKMLIQILRGLEHDGLIERHQYSEIPPRVTYEFADSGKGSAEVLSHVETWVTEHLGTISRAWARYDAEH